MPTDAGRVQKRIVYIVDADAAVREALSRLAESAGFEPKSCASAKVFLRQAHARDAACALLDVSDGALREPAVRARVSVVATMLPVIALSTRDNGTTRTMAREIGAQACFRKPVDGPALLDSIHWVAGVRKPG